jgi:hypothetical protein
LLFRVRVIPSAIGVERMPSHTTTTIISIPMENALLARIDRLVAWLAAARRGSVAATLLRQGLAATIELTDVAAADAADEMIELTGDGLIDDEGEAAARSLSQVPGGGGGAVRSGPVSPLQDRPGVEHWTRLAGGAARCFFGDARARSAPGALTTAAHLAFPFRDRPENCEPRPVECRVYAVHAALGARGGRHRASPGAHQPSSIC